MTVTTDNMDPFGPGDGFGPTDNFDAEDPFLGGLLGGITKALGGILGGGGESFDPFDALDGFNEFGGTENFGADGFGLESFNVEGFGPEGSSSFGGSDQLDAEASAALMEVLADRFANDPESEDNFFPILAALAPLAMKAASVALPAMKALAPMALKAAKAALPQIAKGGAQIVSRLAKSSLGKEAIRVAPTIMRGATANVMRQVAQGRPVSSEMIKRSLAGATASVLQNPQRVRQQIRRNRCVARRVSGVLRMSPASLN